MPCIERRLASSRLIVTSSIMWSSTLQTNTLPPLSSETTLSSIQVVAQPSGSPPDKPPASTEISEQKGDILIRYLWYRRTDSIHDMRGVNTGALSHQNKSLEKCLQTAERGKVEVPGVLPLEAPKLLLFHFLWERPP